MFRATVRAAPRAARAFQQAPHGLTVPRRFASTARASRKGTWFGTFTRLGLAVGAVYYYNTSPVFAEEPEPLTVAPPPQFSDDELPTVNAVIEEKRRKLGRAPPTATETKSTESTKTATLAPGEPGPEANIAQPGGAEALEEEAAGQAAFNPETGEINWDCPCLGGMAHGPCGEEFKAAFSCFVYSEQEPKGMDCIDKFQHMQDCFRLHPEVYGSELEGDEEDGAGHAAAAENARTSEGSVGGSLSPESTAIQPHETVASPPAEKHDARTTPKENDEKQDKKSAVDSAIVPKKAMDATDANEGKE